MAESVQNASLDPPVRGFPASAEIVAHRSIRMLRFHALTILAGSSQSLISDSADSEFYQMRQRKEAISAEIKACLDLYFAGRGKEEVQVRLAVSSLIWGVKSKEAADQLPLEQLERGLRILDAYEKLPNKKLEDRASVLEQITECIKEYDRGESEDWETLPF